MLYDPIHMKCPQQANPQKQKVGLPGAAGRGTGSDCSWAQGFFLGGQKCSKLVNMVKTTELYVRFKRVNFIVRALYLNKAGIH